MSSKVIVNNRVALRSTAAHAAVGGSRLLYIANRPGAVTLKTEDDLRIERENELMAKLGYIGFRPGSVTEPNSGHALFDLSGIPERRKVARKLSETDSAIITTVVSVRNEDAEGLGLLTKQQWERAVRAFWPRYIERLGIIAPENIEFVAAFHISQTSRHVHIFTWDRSGDFNSLLPRSRMMEANDELRSLMLRPRQEALNLARTEARDELVASARELVCHEGELAEAIRTQIPESGSIKFRAIARRAPENARTIREKTLEAVLSSQRTRRLYNSYLDTVRENAGLKSLSGDALEAYVRAARNDLDARICNAAIASAMPRPTRPRLDESRTDTVGLDDGMAGSDSGAEAALLPRERKRMTSLGEELSSILSGRERESLAKSLATTEPGAPTP